MIYDSDLCITWLQDAKHDQALEHAADLRMDWNEAMDKAEQLKYGGYF